MPVEFVGGLFPQNQLAPRSAYQGPIDLDYLKRLAQAHEKADFDRVLIATGGGDPQFIAAYAAAHTEKLGFMVAHRPGVVAPAVAARAFATLDQITKGRIRLHAVTGHTSEPEHGDYLVDKSERYARADEYLTILRKTWTSDQPFDFEGRFYNLKNVFSPIKPLQSPHIPISLGGSSNDAYHVAVRQTDLYALWAEPYADIAERIRYLRETALVQKVQAPRVSLSVRLIIANTTAAAWEKAEHIVHALRQHHQAGLSVPHRGDSGGALRQQAIAARGELHDKALYMGTSTAIGTGTDSTALVGTPDTVIEALLDYYDIGVTTFLNRGYFPLEDAEEYGRYIIPAVRQEVKRREIKHATQPLETAA